MKAIKNGKPHEVSTPEQFVETFTKASITDQHFLCELYLHNEAIPENRKINLNPLVGDVQIRAFASFLANQITWQTVFLAAKHNEDNYLLWIQPEPQNPANFIWEYRQFLKEPGMVEHIRKLKATVQHDC